MRIKAIIGGMSEGEVGSELFDELLRIYPKGRTSSIMFRAELNEKDPKAEQILSLLRLKGFKPWNRFRPIGPSEFRFALQRDYERKDWENASFLIPYARVEIADRDVRNSGGLLVLNAAYSRIKERPPFAAIGSCLAVSTELKSELLKAEMRHLLFKRTIMIGDAAQAKPYEDYYWELTSDLTLPRLAASCNLVDGIRGAPWDGTMDKVCLIDEGFCMPAELHYSARDLEKVEPLDLALTFEPLELNKVPVASKNFYNFCVGRKLKIDWVPVRVH